MPFHMLLGHLYIFFRKMYTQFLCLGLNWVLCLFIVELQEFFLCFRGNSLIRYIICKYFLLFLGLSFSAWLRGPGLWQLLLLRDSVGEVTHRFLAEGSRDPVQAHLYNCEDGW